MAVTTIVATATMAAETLPQAKTRVAAPPVAAAPVQTVDAARSRLSGVQATIAALDAQIAEPAPRGLTAAQLAEWKEHGAWLLSVRQRYATFLAENGGTFGDTPGLAGVAGADMAKKMAQMNVQFLALQEATQQESRRFQTLSNASKARHDVALNAIRNMK
jgi:hypothetical protein